MPLVDGALSQLGAYQTLERLEGDHSWLAALGISRDDAGAFMHAYTDAEIYRTDPFVSIDVEGVGALVRIGAERGRATRGDLKLGVCGEHGGDPNSIDFCEEVGLDYVSCSPYRVPIARLAAAQARLRRL